MIEHIRGLIAAPFTPMKDDGSVNLDLIEEQADFLCRSGVVGVFVCGTSGEGMSLTMSERMAVTRRWAEVAPKGFKVITHIGHTCIEDSLTLAADAVKAGVWGTACIGPSFFKPGCVDELVDYCRNVAEASPGVPFYYYHVPSMSGVNLPMIDFLQAAADKIPNLAGIKYTWENLMDFGLCCRLDSGRFDMLFGRDEILLCGLMLGAKGAVGSTYNYMAPLYVRLIEAYESGNLNAARDIQCKAMRHVQTLMKYGGGVAAGKAIMKLIGIDCGSCRTPLPRFDPDRLKIFQAELEKQGFFEYCIRPSG